VLYKASNFYDPESERTIAWNDPELRIDWQLANSPTVSVKDSQGVSFGDAEVFA
jgi:dTDP-4-dehydrorhamnose 3,5-epimerase